jgi:hypothetical protein
MCQSGELYNHLKREAEEQHEEYREAEIVDARIMNLALGEQNGVIELPAVNYEQDSRIELDNRCHHSSFSATLTTND